MEFTLLAFVIFQNGDSKMKMTLFLANLYAQIQYDFKYNLLMRYLYDSYKMIEIMTAITLYQ